MTLVNSGLVSVPKIPSQMVFVNGVWAAGLFCESVSMGSNGSHAVISCPAMRFETDKRFLRNSEIVVYASDNVDPSSSSTPVFRGYVDRVRSNLRDSRVMAYCSSVYTRFRSRSMGLRSNYSHRDEDIPHRSFVRGALENFPEFHPNYVSADVFVNWTPYSLLEYFIQSSMEPEFREKIQFFFDPSLLVRLPYTTPVYKWEATSNPLEPELVLSVQLHSSLGEQNIRLMDWGVFLDYIASLMVGCDIFEYFTPEGTAIWFSPPFRNGWLRANTGVRGYHWTDVGASVSELTVTEDNSSTTNRFVGLGAPATFTVTLLSNDIDPDDPSCIRGLIPAWEPYDLNGLPPADPIPLHGVSSFNYDTGTWDTGTLSPQTLTNVIKNPGLADSRSPGYNPMYEGVGRKWRLPNWFNQMKISSNLDMFSNPESGNSESFQVFVEKAVEGTDGNWMYDWFAYHGGVSFDEQTKTLTLEEIPLTYTLKQQTIDEELFLRPTYDDELNGLRLCRVGFTFTYANRQYIPCADSHLELEGFYDEDRFTGILSGQPELFERLDLGFSQISNINMPIVAGYKERFSLQLALPGFGTWITQVPTDEPFRETYKDLLVEAYANGGVSNMIRIDPKNTPVQYPPGLEAPMVIRDDTKKLHDLVSLLWSLSGRLARSFELSFGWFVRGAMRGLLIQIGNQPFHKDDWDIVSSVSHNFREGSTTITTSNQIGEKLDVLVLPGD